MLTAELMRQMDTKHFISAARMHTGNWFEHVLLDRLEEMYNKLCIDGRILRDMAKQHVLTLQKLAENADDGKCRMADLVYALQDLANDAEDIADQAENVFDIAKDLKGTGND